MAISKYTLYKYVKVDGTWRYCKAAYHDNAKIKADIVFVNVREGLLEKHPEGRYYMSHNGSWIDAGTGDALSSRMHPVYRELSGVCWVDGNLARQ